MNAELRTKWIAALRSGEYTQGTGYLRDRDAFCCLGVLCEVAEIPRGKTGGFYRFFDADPSDYTLHGSLRMAVGDNETSELINMNDDGSSFAEIADWIEKNVAETA